VNYNMDEVKFEDVKDSNTPEEDDKPEKLSMVNKVDEIYDALKDIKKKKIKLPRRAKVNKRKLKKGFVGVIYIDENGNIWGEKEKVDGGCMKEKKAIRYHATDGREILFWDGKFPVVIQPTWKKNPLNVRNDIENNQTYGQKYIMARMLADVIKIKNKGGFSIAIIIALIVGGYILYTMFTGG